MSDNEVKIVKKLKKRYVIIFIITLFLIGILAVSVSNIKLMEYSKNHENSTNPLDDIITEDNSLKIDIEENLSENKLNIRKNLIIESGDELPKIRDYFVEDNIDNLYFLHYYNDDGNELDSTSFTYVKNDKKITKGKHEIGIIIKKEDQRFDSTLIIRDTTPPIVQLKELTINYRDSFFAIDFIDSYSDNSSESEYIVKIVNNQTNWAVGSHEIILRICDLASNCIDKNTKLTVNNNQNENYNNEDNKDSSNDNNSDIIDNNNNSNNDSDNNNSNEHNSNNDNALDNDNIGIIPDNNDNVNENPEDNNSNNEGNNNNDDVPVYLETRTEQRTISTENRYGTLIHKNGLVTYELYNDGSIIIVNTSNIYYTVDYSGYNGTTLQLKPEAVQTYNNSEITINNVLTKTNEYRKEVGVHGLVIDKELSIMASIRAMELAYSDTFAHLRPNGDSWTTLWKEYGYKFTAGSLYGENLAMNYSSDFAACEGWKNSQSHYSNIINSKYNKLGVGKFYFNGKTYWVQLFAT